MNARRATVMAITATFCTAVGIGHAQQAATDPVRPEVLKVGMATTTITPKGSYQLRGFSARKDPSTGVYKDLTVSVLVLDNGARRVGLMAIDIIHINDAQLEDIRQAAAKAGIPRECMMVNCSHTHCAPDFRSDEKISKMFRERTCGLLKAAVADMREASLDYTVGSCTMAINRRRIGADGMAHWGPDPRQPIDTDVPVLRVLSPEGKVRAVVFGYACHPTAMGGLEIGPDFPGYARDVVAQANPGCLPIFLQGCGGDIKPRSLTDKGKFEYKSHDNLVELGHELGRAVLAAVCVPPPPLDTYLGGVSQMVSLPGKEDPNKPYTIEMQVLRIGDLQIIGANGELCVAIGLHIKRELSDLKAWVNGYTNVDGEYLPAAASFPRGGYEVDECPAGPGAEEILVKKAVELAESAKAEQAEARAVPRK